MEKTWKTWKVGSMPVSPRRFFVRYPIALKNLSYKDTGYADLGNLKLRKNITGAQRYSHLKITLISMFFPCFFMASPRYCSTLLRDMTVIVGPLSEPMNIIEQFSPGSFAFFGDFPCFFHEKTWKKHGKTWKNMENMENMEKHGKSRKNTFWVPVHR